MFHSLEELTPSIFSTLGVDTENMLEIETNSAARECLLIVDGLGSLQLADYPEQAPHLHRLIRDARGVSQLQVGFPSTTVTSLTSLGTGLSPGEHGMLGYTVRVPDSGDPGRLLNPLKWDTRVDPFYWQPEATMFERARDHGIAVSHVALPRYEGSGFTEASLRGAQYVGATTAADLAREAAKALSSAQSFAYVYTNELDAAGHTFGVGTEEWLATLLRVDNLVAALLSQLPRGSRLWVSSDHGMVNVEEKIIIEGDLAEDLTLVGGEPRARHLYVREGSESDVVDRWQKLLGRKVEVMVKDEAIATGLFGKTVVERSYRRLGDVIAIPFNHTILIDSSRVREEGLMVGHHGARTAEEILVPLLNHILA